MKTRPGECEGFQESGKNILAKGQLISKGLFWLHHLDQKPDRFLKDFCPGL